MLLTFRCNFFVFVPLLRHNGSDGNSTFHRMLCCHDNKQTEHHPTEANLAIQSLTAGDLSLC